MAACSVFALSFIAPGFAMGGYGGGGGGMTMGGGGIDDYSVAVSLIRQAKYDRATVYLDRALKNNPHNANILNYLGYAHRMLGDYPASLDFYQKALAINPDHKGAHEYLGELYLMMHDSASADGQLAELTRLCPDGCEEKDVLTKAIADYHAAAHAAATQTATQQ
ncbi:MAG: tetratricopeptide repeat protein [Proteobacteria bacterium]|nr:tetratricopeptide repeat protein [Pseudomonadota bacterium]